MNVTTVTHFEQKCKIYSEKKVSKSDDSYTLWSTRGKDRNKKVSKSDDSYTLWSIRGKDKDKQMSKSDDSYAKGATTTRGREMAGDEKY